MSVPWGAHKQLSLTDYHVPIMNRAASGRPFLFAPSGAPARGKPCRGARASAHRKVACGPRSWNCPSCRSRPPTRASRSQGAAAGAAFCLAKEGPARHWPGLGEDGTSTRTPGTVGEIGGAVPRLAEKRLAPLSDGQRVELEMVSLGPRPRRYIRGREQVQQGREGGLCVSKLAGFANSRSRASPAAIAVAIVAIAVGIFALGPVILTMASAA
jgi:hypothetical protein